MSTDALTVTRTLSLGRARTNYEKALAAEIAVARLQGMPLRESLLEALKEADYILAEVRHAALCYEELERQDEDPHNPKWQIALNISNRLYAAIFKPQPKEQQ